MMSVLELNWVASDRPEEGSSTERIWIFKSELKKKIRSVEELDILLPRLQFWRGGEICEKEGGL